MGVLWQVVKKNSGGKRKIKNNMNLKDKITKDLAISEFKRLCTEPFTAHQRGYNIGTQSVRNS